MMEWISVKDRLPESYDMYIACLKNKMVTEMHFSNFGESRWFKLGLGDEQKENPVTHWMPLPEPPNQ